jgi:cytochrome bd ubiquinol oxidase subunit II
MVGLSTVALFAMHGAIYLTMKTEGRLFVKIHLLLKRATIFFVVSFGITTLYTLLYIPHLSDQFKQAPVLFVLPLAAFLSIANIPRLVSRKQYGWAFFFSSLTVALLLGLVAVELYPVMLLSTISPEYSLDVYRAAASEKSLGIMLLIAAIGAPLVLAYTAFVFWTFKGKVKLDDTSY